MRWRRDGEVLLEHIRPNLGLQSADVFAREYGDAYENDWATAMTVLCAVAPAGLQRFVATSAFDQEESKTVTARCRPASG